LIALLRDETLEIPFQNENLVARANGELRVVFGPTPLDSRSHSIQSRHCAMARASLLQSPSGPSNS
jgi:hypothetical protein